MNQNDPIVRGLEDQITEMVKKDNNASTLFDYSELPSQNKSMVMVTTVNSRTNETFLLKEVIAEDYAECLKEVIHYLETRKECDPFAVQWRKKGGHDEVHTSYFYEPDVIEVTKKFFHDRKVDEYIVYSIEMRPRA